MKTDDYDPVECLRKEVERFKATNTFTPMEVTNFYVQAGLVLAERDRLVEQVRQADIKRAWLESEYNRMGRALNAGHQAYSQALRVIRDFKVAVAFVTGMRPGSENAFAQPLRDADKIAPPVAPRVPASFGDYRQELFNYVANEFNYTMLESQMGDIEHIILGSHPTIAAVISLLQQEGEHGLLESAENRMRELESLKTRAAALYAGLTKVKETLRGFTTSISEVELDALLVIDPTDSVWLEQARYTLGLLSAARSHLPETASVGSLPNALDREIERMQKLIPQDATGDNANE